MASKISNLQWRPVAAEMIATFFFVFLGVGAVIMVVNMAGGGGDAGSLIAIALAHGLAIAVLVAAIGHLSGGHINPAVTLGAMVTKRISIQYGVLYIAAQLVGGGLGALVIAVVIPDAMGGGLGNGAGTLGTHALASGVDQWQGVVVEMILTAVLVFVVFGAAMDKRGVGVIAPLAIGLAVVVDHFAGVGLTGASMNPARTFGPALMANAWGDWWVYLVGPAAGGAIAALVYHKVFQAEE
jgi:MIP family channel proteins